MFGLGQFLTKTKYTDQDLSTESNSAFCSLFSFFITFGLLFTSCVKSLWIPKIESIPPFSGTPLFCVCSPIQTLSHSDRKHLLSSYYTLVTG